MACTPRGRVSLYVDAFAVIEFAPKEKVKSEWDGMEKSIIANFTDDASIGVPSGKLEMTVTKAFNLEEEKMTINKSLNATEMTVALAGRLDTTTAPQLEAELKISLNGVDSLVMDFAELDYISSAGLRVLLSTQKVMNKQGRMVIRHPNETILEVLEVTGFTAIMTIE